jgi:hypothetical protein
MDRVLSLLAALVGLIALGGAILVHTNADMQRREMATEIAQLKASMSLLGTPAATPARADAATPLLPPASSSVSASNLPSASMPSVAAPAPSSPEGVTGSEAMQELQDRIASLERMTASQAAELDAARAQLAAAASAPPGAAMSTDVAGVTPLAAATVASGQPAATPAAVSADGPTKDCIPLGTRFMGQSGDSFPLCKTHIVLKVAAVTDGLATISGAGDVAVGATVPYNKGCMLAVFSADDSGFAEMRVTCQ